LLAGLIKSKSNQRKEINMAIEGLNKCAVRKCGGSCAEGTNLCHKHMVPGMGVKHGSTTTVVTVWYAEQANEAGIILLNDYALGDLFGGAAGFKAKLEQQGFSKVRNLRTPEELEAAGIQVANAPGNWSGPWSTEYPWENYEPSSDGGI
jgi:hypothetical protein